MSWTLYRWVWKVVSPLFIGATPSGALNRCRIYIPARPLWGALTAELARRETDADPEYRRTGDALREHMRLSYLYPAEFVDGEWRAWLPRYEAGEGLCWARENRQTTSSDRRFRRRLLWTRPGTAIDPDCDSALEGSLRETECVQTRWRADDGSRGGPVTMVGYVLFRRDNGFVDRVDPVKTIFVGGDTRYGLGRLERAAMTAATSVFGARVLLEQDDPQVVTGHLLAHGQSDGQVALFGDQEAVGGWDMTGRYQERRISGPAWTPGSRCQEDEAHPWTFLPDGMLRLTQATE